MPITTRSAKLCRAFVPAALGWVILSPAPSVGADAERGVFSRRLEFAPGKEIPLEAVVGRVRVASVTVEVEKWGQGSHYLRVRLAAHNPEGHDQTVRIRAQFADVEGNILATADGEKEIEEDETKTLKVGTKVDFDPGPTIASFVLELESWDD